MPTPDALSAYLVQVVDKIERHGWVVQGVFGTEAEPVPPFAYTVGLSGRTPRLPEVLVHGLPHDVSHSILNDVAARMVAGEEFEVSVDTFDVLGGGYEVQFLPARTSDLAIARQLYSRVDALQLVYPDAGHRFPWVDGYAGPPQPLSTKWTN